MLDDKRLTALTYSSTTFTTLPFLWCLVMVGSIQSLSLALQTVLVVYCSLGEALHLPMKSL